MNLVFKESKFFLGQVLKLSKKYKKLMVDRNDFKATYAGKLDANLGYGLGKVRMKNSSIPKGKRGGFRIIIYTVTDTGVVRPLLIYSKSEYATITDREIQYALEKVIQEETNM